MPVVDRRSVRRESCRADRPVVVDGDVLAALKEISDAICALTDVIETGLAELTSALRDAAAEKEVI